MFFKQKLKNYTIFLALIFIIPAIATATQTLVLPADKDDFSMEKYLEILEDPGTILTLDDVLSPEYNSKFSPAGEKGLNFSFTKSVIWVRFKAENLIEHSPPFVLFLNFANINYVDFYQLSADNKLIKKVKTGNLLPLSSRDHLDPHIMFILSISSKEENTIYLRIKNDAAMNLSMSMMTVDKFLKNRRINNFFMGIFIGIMLILIGYNFSLSISFKDKSYFYFNFSIIFLLIYTLSYKGYAYLYLWPDIPLFNKLSIAITVGLSVFFFLLFTNNFLLLKKRFPLHHKIIKVLSVTVLSLVFSSVFINFQIVIQLINICIAVGFLFSLYASYISWRGKYSPAGLFLVSMLFLSSGSIITIFVIFGFLETRLLTDNGFLLGSIPYAISMSLALAQRIKVLKSEKDITDDILAKSIEKFQSIIDTNNDIFWETDRFSTFHYISPNVEKITGWKAEELIGKKAFDLLDKIEIERLIKTLKMSASTNTPVSDYEYRMLNKSGNWMILEKNAKPFYNNHGKFDGFRGNDRDITMHYHQKEVLQESEEKFKSIVENTHTGIILLDDNFHFIYVNPEGEKLSGYSAEELLNKDFRELVDIEKGISLSNMYKQRQEGESLPTSYETEFIHKDGTIKPIQVFMQIINKPDHTPITIAQIIDLSEQKHLEEQLIQSQKMEAIGTLAGGIAHDFNNLLTVIKGYSDVLLMRLKQDDPKRKHIEIILSASKKAESLTKQILAFSRKQLYQPQKIDINHHLAALIKMTSRIIGEDIEIEMIFGKDLSIIKADPGQIEQVVINLLVNARDAINQNKNIKKKKITIKTQYLYLDETFVEKHVGAHIGEHIEISVLDTGIGMSHEVQGKIFEPFFTTKDREKSTGLGLATVYGIVTQNEGFIIIDSQPGSGAVFKIYWPINSVNNTEIEES